MKIHSIIQQISNQKAKLLVYCFRFNSSALDSYLIEKIKKRETEGGEKEITNKVCNLGFSLIIVLVLS